MKIIQTSSSKQLHVSTAQRILEFWHKVEFFIPFDLKQVLECKGAGWCVRSFEISGLLSIASEALLEFHPPQGELAGFELYIGIFDKADLVTITEKVLSEHLTDNEIHDQAERLDLEGLTCFARIKLNSKGEPLLDEVSVSTVPWALGSIQKHGMSGLSFDAFQLDIVSLKEQLRNFQVQRTNEYNKRASIFPNDKAISKDQIVLPLTGEDILALINVFYDWAEYQPISSIEKEFVVIRARASVSSKKFDSSREKEVETEIEDEEEPELIEDAEIDILNSFFAKDIELAINSIKVGNINSALLKFLTPVKEESHIDLYTSDGQAFLFNNLFPSSLNTGHWLTDSEKVMSLMQQFAIGRVFDLLKTEGMFSVNGPPGTGKTTLLRDIFAENITRRARVLAGYSKSRDAFLPDKITVNFEGEMGPLKISVLKPELTGFEMVVASYNNAAVENISRDLPKTEALGKTEWRYAPSGLGRMGYLQPVAHKIASENSKGGFDPLSCDDTPWGLISCVLGNQTNRKAFSKRIRLPGTNIEKTYPNGLKEPYPENFSPDVHQSIWMWKNAYKGSTFADAKTAFLKADSDVQTRLKQLQTFAKLANELKGHSQKTYTQKEITALNKAQASFQKNQALFTSIESNLKFVLRQLEDLKELEILIKDQRPSWFSRIFNKSKFNQYKAEIADCHSRQRKHLLDKVDLDSKCQAAKRDYTEAGNNLKRAQTSLATRQSAWELKARTLQELDKVFPNATYPNSLDELDSKDWQIAGFWHDDELNRLRSELFATALVLHQAWLSEVLSNGGGFSHNIIAVCDLLACKRLVETTHTLSIWQSLFMLVPVISSTFSSIASQFRYLGCNSLGWLFIDEAGQSVPQAAVGALWRSKRAVVVGDPLQIEPVFTVPIKLIEALFNSSGLPDEIKVMPHKVSVQNLADLANHLGTWATAENDQRQWIGSPLRVHRRCVEPMFRIANEIAYEDKMFYGFKDVDPPANTLNIGRSAWVNVGGSVSVKQVVPSQIELVFQAFVALYQSQKRLPPLYIISPFKQIKNELISALSDIRKWEAIQATDIPQTKKLIEWCRENIGTVHTFQGKENSIVWMVLGCDAKTLGAVSWASNKPNILNVALTRAQHRFFMIGDANIWSTRQYFSTAYKHLPPVSDKDFLLRMKI